MIDLKTKKGIFIIAGIIIIIYSFIGITFFKGYLTDYLNENFRQVRCYPHIIPVAGLSKNAPGNNFFDKTFRNFSSCGTTFIQKFLALFMVPLMMLIKGISKGIQSIKNIIDKFRNMASVLRNMFAALVENTAKRMQNSYGAVIYLQEKMKNLIKRQSAMIEIVKHFLGTLPLLLYSFSYGPIPRFAYWLTSYLVILIIVLVFCLLCAFGGPFVKMFTCPICALCFDENTEVEKEDGSTIKLKYLNLGDKIKGGEVTGILSTDNLNWELYNYKGVIVSGSHLVYEDNQWIRIEESSLSTRVYNECRVICIITSEHNVFINGIKFRDYEECNDRDIAQTINYAVAKYCNNNMGYVKVENDLEHLYNWGFSGDTLVKINNNFVSIKEIVENKLTDENIIGRVVLSGKDIKLFEFDGVKVSGNTLMNNGKLWERVHQTNLGTQIEKEKIIYNLITINNLLEIKGNEKTYIFRDFPEDYNEELNNKIDSFVQERLNIMRYN
tara:strand:+ start:1493 stop:2983 length:1491 start_codon:yes stop_codon:yes gene_type:complete